jgi:hypothetical protein
LRSCIWRYSLVCQGHAFSVPTHQFIAHCPIFRTRPGLRAKPYDFQSRVSIDSFRTFVGAIGGTRPEITDGNARDLGLLSGEFEFRALAKAIAD